MRNPAPSTYRPTDRVAAYLVDLFVADNISVADAQHVAAAFVGGRPMGAGASPDVERLGLAITDRYGRSLTLKAHSACDSVAPRPRWRNGDPIGEGTPRSS